MIEYVAYGPEASEIDGLLGVLFEVSAEADDEIVHGAGVDDPGISPADFQELLPGERLATVGDKQFQKLHFLFGQGDLAASDMGRRGAEINPVAPKGVSPGQ